MSVIFVDATPDLGQWGRIPELTGYFQRSGVETFYFHPHEHGDEQSLASWIYHEKVQRGRQVVLVGWSYGLIDSLDALKILEKQRVGVDTLISIDCFLLNLQRGTDLQPPNAERVVLIYRKYAKLPVGFCNPAVCRVDSCNHLGMPGHPTTVNTLFQETLRLGQMQGCGDHGCGDVGCGEAGCTDSGPLLMPTAVVCPGCGKRHSEGAAPVQQVSRAMPIQGSVRR